MNSSFQDAWREVSGYLDEVLDLESEARQAWLENLEKRAPAMAGKVRSYLLELEQLKEQNFLGTAAAYALRAATLAGQRFGAYTLDRPIGHGGMGTVWLAHRSDGRFEGQAALKLLNIALVGHPSEQRFEREGNVLARLRHPNIAQLFDAGVAAGNHPYLVLEYVDGERIDLYCEQHQLSIKQRVRLFLNVLSAVAHAHHNLIVHRDLKPSNILVTAQGEVKLLDFGVAGLLSPDAASTATQLTHHGAPGLTPAYAAPEQLLGEAVTTATDVYALGLVLFVLLAGRHPASPESKTAAELMQLTLDTEAPRPSEIATNVRHGRLLRGDLDNIIAMALRRNPAERYANVDLFAQDLRRYLALEPVSARPRSFRYRATMFVRRNCGSVIAAHVVVAMLIGAMAVTISQMAEARRQRDEARDQSRRVESSDEFLKLLMLSDFGPTRAATTLHERLELGIELLDKQYPDDPKFAGRMLVELATYFTEIQETRRADALYARAYDIGRRHDDAELMAYAQCHRIYGEVSADIRVNVAEQVREVQQLLARIDNPTATVRADCLASQARVERANRHVPEAETLLRQALSILEADSSRRPDLYVSIMADLGSLYLVAANKPREALQVLQRAGEIYDRAGRGGTVGRLAMRSNAVIALNSMGESRAALAEREVINQRARELVSSEHELLAYRVNYATMLLRMARPADALAALDGVLEQARRAGHRTMLAQTLLATGSAFVQTKRWDEADAALKEAAALTDGPANKSLRLQAEHLTARLDLGRGDLVSAQRHSTASLKLAGYGTEKPERNLARALLIGAEVALARRDAANAEQFSRDALAIGEARARGPNTSGEVGESLLRLVQARALSGKNGDSRALLDRSVLCLTNGLGPDHPLTVEARNMLAGA